MKKDHLRAVVDEARDVVLALRTLSTVAASKLTTSAFRKMARQVALGTGSSEERLAECRKWAEELAPESVKATLRRMVAAARSLNFPTPPRELRRFNYLTTADAVAELAARGFNSFELFAAASEIATEQFPGDFGTCSDLQAQERRIVELTLRRDALFGRIANEWTNDDIDFRDGDSQGRVRVTYRFTDGAVPVWPKENAGERLVNWVLGSGG